MRQIPKNVCPSAHLNTSSPLELEAFLMGAIEQLNSICAVYDCMDSLNFEDRTKRLYEARAKVKFPGKRPMPGEVIVRFETLNVSEGPEINCALHIMMGYGIHQEYFRPGIETFTYAAASKELTIKGKSYQFILVFDQ
jgi:hypothetical protein